MQDYFREDNGDQFFRNSTRHSFEILRLMKDEVKILIVLKTLH